MVANTGAVNAAHVEAAIVRFTVTVSTRMGDPIDDCTTVLLKGPGIHMVCTNASGGTYTAMYSGTSAGFGPCPPHDKEISFQAEANYKGRKTTSDILPITFLGLKITSSIVYSYTYDYYYEGAFMRADASIVGGGTGCYGHFGECSGNLTRSYSWEHNTHSSRAIGNLVIPACNITPTYSYVPIEGTNLSVGLLTGVKVEICYMLENIEIEACPAGEACNTYYDDLRTGPESYSLDFPFSCNSGLGGGIQFSNNGSGTFEPYTWELLQSGEFFSKAATLNIDVAAGF